jgi:hypothetical protein
MYDSTTDVCRCGHWVLPDIFQSECLDISLLKHLSIVLFKH